MNCIKAGIELCSQCKSGPTGAACRIQFYDDNLSFIIREADLRGYLIWFFKKDRPKYMKDDDIYLEFAMKHYYPDHYDMYYKTKMMVLMLK